MITRCLRSGSVVCPLRADAPGGPSRRCGCRRHSRVVILVGVASGTSAHRRLLPVCCPRSPNQAPNARSRVRGPGLTCGVVWWARQGLNL
jgi:hypothetical protein